MQAFYRPAAPLTVDTNQAQKLFEDPDTKPTIDDSILDHSAIDSGLELSPPMHDSRRESFATGGPLFSPKTEDWGQAPDMQSLPSNNPFLTSNNPYRNQTQQFAVAQTSPWPMDNSTGTFFQPFDAMSADYDANTSVLQRAMSGQSVFTGPNHMFNFTAGNQSIPSSPQKDWMNPSNGMGSRMQPDSPAIRSHNELRRGDGIRKKNARFDIPAERNLSNIDQLIAQSTDDQEVKELKQQKRLLRNRQAALDSRQRKKIHTERLENEKKEFNSLMSQYEEVNDQLSRKVEQVEMEKAAYIQYIDNITLEKDELIRQHTVETGDLRKKISVLTEYIHKLELSQPAPSNHANGIYASNAFEEMEGMAMTGPWDSNGFINEYAADPEPVQPDMAMVSVKKVDNTAAEGESTSSQSGFLFMLFLVGAFVMSSRSAAAPLPVSEDVRVASATLLDNVLRDAGVNSQASGAQAMAARASTTAWAAAPAVSMHANEMLMDHVAPSMLAELGESLTQPTQKQSNEQLFGLSAAQYNGVNDQEFLQNAPEKTSSEGRKTLATALAKMREAQKQSGAADVYSRSLLWDRVPREVVRSFAKMINERHPSQSAAMQQTEGMKPTENVSR